MKSFDTDAVCSINKPGKRQFADSTPDSVVLLILAFVLNRLSS